MIGDVMEKTAKECGKCGGTGEICYSSTSYGPCPECIERYRSEGQSAALHESRVEKCPECGNGPDNPREDSIERMLHCGSQFHPCNRPEAHPEPRTVEEALALVTGGPDDYCDPKDQPEPERGTITGMQVSYPATYYLARAHVMAEKYLQHESRWRELTVENMTEHDAFELNFMHECLWSDMIAAEDAAMAPSPLPVREQSTESNNGGWISVDDRLPDLGVTVDIWIETSTGGYRRANVSREFPSDYSSWCWAISDDGDSYDGHDLEELLDGYNAPFWRPLPESPMAIAGEKEE